MRLPAPPVQELDGVFLHSCVSRACSRYSASEPGEASTSL
jgi:hypothetical protein